VLWNGTNGLPRRDGAWGFVALGLSLKWMFRKDVKVKHLQEIHSVFNG
jgi:hypothetical protein